MKEVEATRLLTKKEQVFLLSATDWLEDPELVNMTKVKILSRLSALGFGIKESPKAASKTTVNKEGQEYAENVQVELADIRKRVLES